jgi:hypothetical protein
MNIKIIVATHKEYPMPEDKIYLPIHVGSAGKKALPYQPDNTGDNISEKNPSYCELTGLYWGWKNLDCDYLGLAHYRRHFTVKGRRYRHSHTPMECVLTGEELEPLLLKYPIIVPKKRRYMIESLYSHYKHTHYSEHLDVTREIIQDQHPEYLPAFDAVMKKTSGHMFNMFIMKKELADEYCQWLFSILFELESRLGDQEYSYFQGRFYGRVSEIIFNVWLAHRQEAIKEIPFLHMEKVDWKKKGTAFLKAKFGNKKYEGSF